MGKASYAQTITIPTAERGDTFSGQSFTLTVNDSLVDLTGATITLTLAGGHGSLTTTDSGGITITDAAAGEFEIDEQVINFSARTHNVELKFILADGSIKTYGEGTWEITN